MKLRSALASLSVVVVATIGLAGCAAEEAPEQSDGVIRQSKRVTPEEAQRLTKAYDEAPITCRAKTPAFCTISEPDADGLVVFEANCKMNVGCCI